VSMWGYEAKTPLLLGTLGFRQFWALCRF
jgi:hypothetical protein